MIDGTLTPLLVVGAAGHASVVAEAAAVCGRFRLVAYLDTLLDPGPEAEIDGVPLLHSLYAVRDLRIHPRSAVVAVGDNRARLRLCSEMTEGGLELATIVHPAAHVAPSATVGEGTVVLAGAVVSSRARLGRAVIVNTGASIDHDCVLGDGAHLSPGSHLGGWVAVGEGTWLGVGAAVRDRVSVGAWSIVGVGAAVVRDLPDRVVAYGVPARVVRRSEGD